MAVPVMTASAQVTEQTDKSEEDWRKSKKKRDASDIFEDILDKRDVGVGTNQYPQNPVESLPEESRLHLMKERAKVIAETEPGHTPDAPYNPSEAAKSDPELAEQEKEAWTVIMTDLEGGESQGQGQGGSGPNKVVVAGQGGQSGEQGNQSQGRSVIRGGSSQSVAEILAQIKGLKSGSGASGGSGQPEPGNGGQTQGPLSQESSDQSAGQSPSGQSQDAASPDQVGSEAEARAKALSEAAQAAADVAQQADASPQTPSATQATFRESMSPLERVKRQRDTQTTGTQTSASDYLKKSD